ncbi:hypothetical protein LUZ61_015125 [Rhynchospora tenuis]|uniref:DDE Tnp4 domain-containing protein n=1 Tax=Rhynchospora tenuis TaxID=198213 RepID=A0AAD5WC15_9POAL|nr:hypothetical protein LUZ61_015125 [Rhynchospora tenuis]
MDNQDNQRRKSSTLVVHLNHLAIVHLTCMVLYRIILDKLDNSKTPAATEEEEEDNEKKKKKKREIQISRDGLLLDLVRSEKCRDIIRMNPRAFFILCRKLEVIGGLKATRQLSVQEQVARFLYILGHNTKHRVMSFFFHRGRATISRDFHRVINALVQLEATYFKQPDGSSTPSEITNSHRFNPYFKDCVGSIDGTHFRVKVNSKEAPKYRGRKDIPTMNVLAACTPDLKFTYILVGSPGTASDSKIMKNALGRRYPLTIPQGKYYLVDAGFMLKSGLITPYRGERYHLKEYSVNPPQNYRELFNLRHSSLRNSIERAFGVLKKRFPIIASGTEPHYNKETQKLIILACCILHNFLLDVDPDNEILAEVDRELANARSRNPQAFNGPDEDENDSMLGEMIRDRIANEMWNDYTLSLGL